MSSDEDASKAKSRKKAPTKKRKADEAKEEHANKKQRSTNFSAEEDVLLARAYVNRSQNGAVGTDQNAKKLWQDIKSVYDDLVVQEKIFAEDEEPLEREWASLKNRYKRYIQKNVTKFVAIYRAEKEKNHSGWNEDKYTEECLKIFKEREGCHFRFVGCLAPMAKMPKYNLNINEVDAGLKTKNMTGVMEGEGMERPLGKKKSKALVAQAKREKHGKPSAASLASLETTKVEAVVALSETQKEVASSQRKLATAMEKKVRSDTWTNLVKLNLQMGNRAEAEKYKLRIDSVD